MNQHSFRTAVGMLAIAGLLAGGLPAWAQSGSGGNQGASSSGSSSGGTQKGQEQMHQERMKEQQPSESSLQMRPDRNDQSHSQPKAPHGGGSESTDKMQQQRGQ